MQLHEKNKKNKECNIYIYKRDRKMHSLLIIKQYILFKIFSQALFIYLWLQNI